MDAFLIHLMAEIAGCNARVEGMKAANQAAAHRGEPQVYGKDAFDAEAATIFHISEAARGRAG